MEDYLLLSFAGIGLLTIFCQWFSWWIKLPAILLLLLVGILIGPVLHWFNPDEVFGPLLTPIISLSVALILFEGGLSLNVKKINGLESVVRKLLSTGFIITIILTGIASYCIFHISWQSALILSTICSVSGPTVISPMLRTIRPNQHLANILTWEGISIDPIGTLLATVFLSIIIAIKEQSQWSLLILSISEILMVGIIAGASFGYLLGQILERRWVPEFLHNVLTLCTVFIVFTACDLIKENTGLLAVTLMGIWIANNHPDITEDLINFKESLSILLISGLFIILAANISLFHIQDLLLPSVALILLLQFIIRPINIIFCTQRSSLKWREKIFLSWIYPRGIVAAAMSALFALKLAEYNIPGANNIKTITFFIIIGTVVFQSVTAPAIASLLKVRDPDPNGLLIIGANRLAREIALVLKNYNIQVLLASTYWDDIREARKEGLPTYFGHPISAHADRHINLVGLGRMLGLSKRDHLNTLACLRYQKEFGKSSVFTLSSHALPGSIEDKHKAAQRHRGGILFGSDITYELMTKQLTKGGKIHSTTFSDEYTYDHFTQSHSQIIPLFAFSPKGKLSIYTEDDKPEPQSDWTLISLVTDHSP